MSRVRVPLKAALVAAIVGGMSETYFYGGMVSFSLLAVYAPTGALLRLRHREALFPIERRHGGAPALAGQHAVTRAAGTNA